MHILSVGQMAGYIKTVLTSDDLLQDAWVRGEVSNLARPPSGHIYFSIKDADSQLKCVLFRQQARLQAYLPADGDQVVVHGRVSLYEASGLLQVYVDLVQRDGLGEAALWLEQVRQRLAAEGLFDERRKRPLPAYPTCIGVVTSAQGAVWHDIQTIIARRYANVTLVLSPAQVQGEGAPASIIAALRRLWERAECDVIIVGRGGGSAEDLWAFNDEGVARAIYASPVPIVSAVGHELDVTIADYVADLRASTPSAAAEMVVPDGRQLRADVLLLRERLQGLATDQIDERRRDLDSAMARLRRTSPRHRLARERQRVDDLTRDLGVPLRHHLALQRQAVVAALARLGALDPRAVLGRGYAMVSTVTTNTVVSAATVESGERLRVRVHDGHFVVQVE
jgi:exodeoxyribonuclease VII large subunit